MIAAGHPPLWFEPATFLSHLPPHWKVRDHNLVAAAREWVVGQAVASAAAYRLLAARAENPAEAWPEFAEYACFGCHKSLDTRPVAAGPAPGRLRFGGWYHGRVPRMEAAFGGRPAGGNQIDNLLLNPLRNQKEISAKATDEAIRLEGLSQEWEKVPPPRDTIRAVLWAELLRTPESWETTTQSGLGLLSTSGRCGLGGCVVRGLLAQAAFPEGFQGPRGRGFRR